jgi:phosphohistidine phosphatase
MAFRLIILRHGKAEKHAPTGRDVDRPLRPRGVRQAAFIAEQLEARGPRPEVICTSPAVRALNTAQIVQRQLGIGLHVDERLAPESSVEHHLDVIQEQAGEGVKALLIAGHNHTLSVLVASLLAPTSRRPGELRTGEAAVLSFPGLVGPGAGKLEVTMRLVDDEEE